MKVVFDTNVFISALAIPGGKAEQAYLLGLAGKYTLYSSPPILTETAQKPSEKFSWEKNKIIHFLRTIAGVAIIVKPQSHLRLLSDEPDNRILECAEEAKADLIVTGDRHLLSIRHFKGTEIITLSKFLKKLLGTE